MCVIEHISVCTTSYDLTYRTRRAVSEDHLSQHLFLEMYILVKTTKEIKQYFFLERKPIYSIFLVVPDLVKQYFFGGHFRKKVFFSFHVPMYRYV